MGVDSGLARNRAQSIRSLLLIYSTSEITSGNTYSLLFLPWLPVLPVLKFLVPLEHHHLVVLSFAPINFESRLRIYQSLLHLHFIKLSSFHHSFLTVFVTSLPNRACCYRQYYSEISWVTKLASHCHPIWVKSPPLATIQPLLIARNKLQGN